MSEEKVVKDKPEEFTGKNVTNLTKVEIVDIQKFF